MELNIGARRMPSLWHLHTTVLLSLTMRHFEGLSQGLWLRIVARWPFKLNGAVSFGLIERERKRVFRKTDYVSTYTNTHTATRNDKVISRFCTWNAKTSKNKWNNINKKIPFQRMLNRWFNWMWWHRRISSNPFRQWCCYKQQFDCGKCGEPNSLSKSRINYRNYNHWTSYYYRFSRLIENTQPKRNGLFICVYSLWIRYHIFYVFIFLSVFVYARLFRIFNILPVYSQFSFVYD